MCMQYRIRTHTLNGLSNEPKWERSVKTKCKKYYNTNMSGTGRANQMMTYHSGLGKKMQWCKKVSDHILEILITNSHKNNFATFD